MLVSSRRQLAPTFHSTVGSRVPPTADSALMRKHTRGKCTPAHRIESETHILGVFSTVAKFSNVSGFATLETASVSRGSGLRLNQN